MEIIGLTGSIGMGKSMTASLLRTLGIPVFDSDECVQSLLKGKAVAQIIKEFPSIRIQDTNSIDKAKLGKIIFEDKEAKSKLESILHPMVWREQDLFIAKCKRAGMKQVVLDVPLLFETGRNKICSKTICVTAPYFIQRQRVLSRKNMTLEKFQSIIENQLPDAQKQRLSDIVIPTGLGRLVTLSHIKKALVTKIQEKDDHA